MSVKVLQKEGEISPQEALRLGLGAEDTGSGLPVEDVAVEGWLAEWLERFTGKALPSTSAQIAWKGFPIFSAYKVPGTS